MGEIGGGSISCGSHALSSSGISGFLLVKKKKKELNLNTLKVSFSFQLVKILFELLLSTD